MVVEGEPRSPNDPPEIGGVDFGSLRRLEPVSRSFGFDRGQPIDRYYIEHFLSANRDAIHGTVLEVGDAGYTRAFGSGHVLRSEILSLTPDNPNATIVADLSDAPQIPDAMFDCFIMTQTLHLIYDLPAVMNTIARILKPSGTLLMTVPTTSQVCRFDMDRWGDYWRFTDASVRRLLEGAFGRERAVVRAHGNVLVAISFLHGLAAEELQHHELDFHDPDYQIVITARVSKSQTVVDAES